MSSLRRCPYFRVYTHLYVTGKVCSVLIKEVIYLFVVLGSDKFEEATEEVTLRKRKAGEK